MSRRKPSRILSLSGIYLVLTLFAGVTLYPLYYSIISSLKTVEDYTLNILGLPGPFTLVNFARVLLDMKMLQFLGNTLLVVGFGLALYLFLCTSAGFAFGKLQFRGRLAVFSLVLFLQIFPQMVIAGQIYQLASRIHLLNTYPGIILIWAAYFAPFGTYIMTTYYAKVPRELVESARLDGAGVYAQLFHILMPVAKPMLGTIGIVGGLAMWNELPFSMLILQKANMRTLTLGIALMKGEFGLPVPVLCAAVLVSAGIPLLLYLFFQNFITMGATAGSVKG